MSQALPDIPDIKLIRTDTTLDLVLNLSPHDYVDEVQMPTGVVCRRA